MKWNTAYATGAGWLGKQAGSDQRVALLAGSENKQSSAAAFLGRENTPKIKSHLSWMGNPFIQVSAHAGTQTAST